MSSLCLGSALTLLPASLARSQCVDCDGDGVAYPADCNDDQPAIFPGAAEACNGFDDDCDGLIDNSTPCLRECTSLSLVAPPLIVSEDPALSQQPSVAWNGNAYGIAWRDGRDKNGDTNNEIYFAAVDATGSKISPDRRVTMALGNSRSPSLVWTGTGYGLAWVDDRDGNDAIFFARLSRDGIKLGQDIRVTAMPGLSTHPALTWTGAEYGIAYQDLRDMNSEIYFSRLDREGVRIGNEVRITADPGVSELPSLAWTGSEYGLAWVDDRIATSNKEIFFARLNGSGVKLTASDVRLSSASGTSTQPTLVWTGTEYGLAWSDDRDGIGNREIYMLRLSSSGAPLISETRLTIKDKLSLAPRLAWTGSEYGIAWRDTFFNGGEVFFARVGADGLKIGADLRVSMDLGLESREPALAWAGTEFGVLWRDTEINLQRLACGCADGDGDGTTSCLDCDDADPQLQTDPGSVRALTLLPGTGGATSLAWSPPSSPGGAVLVYDTLRAPQPDSFQTASCLESNGTDQVSSDGTVPGAGAMFCYLIRAENACSPGNNGVGQTSTGQVRAARSCP